MQTLFINRFSKPKQFLFASLLIILVAGICYLLSPFMGYRVVAFVLLMVVSLIAISFDIGPVMLSALLSALIWDFFFIPPRFTLSVGTAEDTLLLAMYFVIALVNAVLTYKIRQIEKVARQREEKANAIKLYNILLNSLSHELKTPIATIIGATDNLLTDTNKISEQNKYNLLSEISIASVRLNEQVENLLNMSRLESGYIKPKLDWCDVNELVYSAINHLEDKLKDHAVKVEMNESLPLFKIDFGLMEEVLHNLLVNAVTYTAAGSMITIKADCTTDIKGHLTGEPESFVAKRDVVRTNLLLEVIDNGHGFPKEEIENVFDKFYRLKNSKTGGTGLGLSIVKGFVEAHHGTIELSNVEGGGAKFSIKIPAETSYLNKQKHE